MNTKALAQAPTRILAFGDSITDGFQVVVPYPERLYGYLNGSAPVIRAGYPGYTSTMALGVLPSQIAAHNPSHVVLMFGTNDIRSGSDPVDVARNLMDLSQIVRDAGAVPVVATIPPQLGLSGSFSSAVEELNRLISWNRVAGGYVVTDVFEDFSYDFRLMQSDGYHPNDSGMDRIARTVAESLLVVGAWGSAPFEDPQLGMKTWPMFDGRFWTQAFGRLIKLEGQDSIWTESLGWVASQFSSGWFYSPSLGWFTVDPPSSANGYPGFNPEVFQDVFFINHRLDLSAVSLGQVRPGSAEGWVDSSLWGWVSLHGHGRGQPWIFSSRLGWLFHLVEGGLHYFRSDRLNGWLAVTGDQQVWSAQYGWVIFPEEDQMLSSKLGLLTTGDFNGWVWHQRWGWLWPADGAATGVWFWSDARQEWLGSTAGGGIWSSAEERFLD